MISFTEVENIEWYDGPLVSIVKDECDQRYLAVVHQDDHPRSGWRAFVVVPLPEGSTEARAVLRGATSAYLWDYESDVVAFPVPFAVEEFLTGDIELPSI